MLPFVICGDEAHLCQQDSRERRDDGLPYGLIGRLTER